MGNRLRWSVMMTTYSSTSGSVAAAGAAGAAPRKAGEPATVTVSSRRTAGARALAPEPASLDA